MSTTMSEHEWVQENIAGYNTGGLEANERDRLAKHVAACADCRRTVDDLRNFDRKIGALFAEARPSTAMEDRMIQSLRKKTPRRRWPRPHWIVTSAAAVILLGCVGALTELALGEGFLTVRQRWGDAYQRQDGLVAQPHDVLKDAGELAKEVRDEKRNPAESLNSVGYNPPAKALVVKGSS